MTHRENSSIVIKIIASIFIIQIIVIYCFILYTAFSPKNKESIGYDKAIIMIGDEKFTVDVDNVLENKITKQMQITTPDGKIYRADTSNVVLLKNEE